MSHPTTEHQLLFGVLALQLGFISPAELIAALRVWIENKSQSLATLLRKRNLLRTDEESLLLSLLQSLLHRHNDDALRILSTLLPPAVIDKIVSLDDPELRDCLQRVASVPASPTVFERLQTPTLAYSDPAASTATVVTETGAIPPPLTPSSTKERYRRLKPHARGGLGEVFLAHDEELQREVALKEMQSQHLDRADCRARFLLEGEITGRLEHPGIVPVYGLGLYQDGRPYYAMRFIRGESLEHALVRFHGGKPSDPGERTLELRKLLARFVDVCNAIAYAHSKGVLHRDIKPENIMLGPYGETLVVDWGLAKVEATNRGSTLPESSFHSEGFRPPLTETGSLMGQVIGTPQYMSPEQAAGRMDLLGPASDVYSLGATLYSLVSGHRPVPVDSDVQKILRLVQSGSVPPARQVNPKVPRPLEAICQQAMALKPDERYDSAKALAADVERWLADEPVSAFSEPLWSRVRRWGRRHRTTVIAAAVLFVTAVTALGISYVVVAQEQNRTKEEQRRTKQEQLRTKQEIEARAMAQVTALLEANPGAVPDLLSGLTPFRDLVRPRLHTVRFASEPAAGQLRYRHHQTRASLALLAEDPSQVAFLRERLLHPELDPEECLLLRSSLADRAADLAPDLWDKVRRESNSPDKRFRALVALAHFDPTNPLWEDVGAMAVAPLLTADPLHVGVWTRALAPVQRYLIGPLSVTFADPLLPAERRVAATVLREYAENDPKLLVQLLANANETQILLLMPRLQALRDALLPLMHADLQGTVSPKTEEERDSDARRKANLAAVLALLGNPESLWSTLQQSPYPDARTHLIHLLPTLEIDPKSLIERLKVERDDGIRRALILALGGYSREQLPRGMRDDLLPLLLEWYRDKPDPGLHGAIDWLLRNAQEGTHSRKLDWEQGPELAKIDTALQGKPRGQRRWQVTPQGQTMVLLGPDEFVMGSPLEERGDNSDEVAHRRRIGRRFAIADREVTVRLFKQFLADHPLVETRISWSYSPEADCPVVSVSWYEAAQFCRWLSEQEKLPESEMCFPTVTEIEKCKHDRSPLKLPPDYLSRTGYRMPTEAEWEYACRAGSRTSKPHGVSNELLRHYAWDIRDALPRTWPVGQKKPNDFGLFDMHGNVAEWCLSLHEDYPTPKSDEALEDVGAIKEITSGSRCILRGAPFHPRPAPLRTAYRYWHLPSDRFSTVGLRIARTVK